MATDDRGSRKTRARELRLAGHSRAQIARALGLKTGGQALDRWLKGIPPPAWTKRPRAKDSLREKAVAMRLQGRSYREIKQVLGVSQSTLSLWLRDVPLSEEQKAVLKKRRSVAARKRARAIRSTAVARDERIVTEAAAQILSLDETHLFVAGVIAYWAEGTKNKPWRRGERVTFSNSDPGLILLFLRWLDLLGIAGDAVSYRVQIHDSADVRAAVRYWGQITGVPPDRFQPPTLKRHNPRTVNVGDGYHGCLRIDVRRSVELNRRIEGWFKGIVAQTDGSPARAACRGSAEVPVGHTVQ